MFKREKRYVNINNTLYIGNSYLIGNNKFESITRFNFERNKNIRR